jgi:Fe-only nitrogenase delta subunit
MGEATLDVSVDARADQLVDFIMKHCLWQFHSRAWDRERQNREILTKTKEILCEENEEPTDRLDRCHWVDAVMLARNYRKNYPWINAMSNAEIAEVMRKVREKVDYQTITGSLNKELTDEHY